MDPGKAADLLSQLDGAARGQVLNALQSMAQQQGVELTEEVVDRAGEQLRTLGVYKMFCADVIQHMTEPLKRGVFDGEPEIRAAIATGLRKIDMAAGSDNARLSKMIFELFMQYATRPLDDKDPLGDWVSDGLLKNDPRAMFVLLGAVGGSLRDWTDERMRAWWNSLAENHRDGLFMVMRNVTRGHIQNLAALKKETMRTGDTSAYDAIMSGLDMIAGMSLNMASVGLAHARVDPPDPQRGPRDPGGPD